MKRTVFNYLILIVFLTGCYHTSKVQIGNHIYFYKTKNKLSDKEKYDKYYKWCNDSTLTIGEKANRKVLMKVSKDYSFYDYDSVRVFISPHIFGGFLSNDSSECWNIYQKFIEDYGIIFEKGLITGSDFYCGFCRTCEIPQNTNEPILNLNSSDSLKLNLFGYKGPIVKILNIKDLTKESHAPEHIRCFEFWLTKSKFESGWGMFPMFYIEFKNEQGTINMSIRDFLADAKVSMFMFEGYQF